MKRSIQMCFHLLRLHLIEIMWIFILNIALKFILMDNFKDIISILNIKDKNK